MQYTDETKADIMENAKQYTKELREIVESSGDLSKLFLDVEAFKSTSTDDWRVEFLLHHPSPTVRVYVDSRWGVEFGNSFGMSPDGKDRHAITLIGGHAELWEDVAKKYL